MQCDCFFTSKARSHGLSWPVRQFCCCSRARAAADQGRRRTECILAGNKQAQVHLGAGRALWREAVIVAGRTAGSLAT